MPGQVEQLGITPVIEDEGWAGYQHFTDPTRLPFNVLTYPSLNCHIPSFDKIVPDRGKKLIAQQWTENSKIIGNKEKFTTMGGEELEVRVWASQFLLRVEDIVGTFQIGEVITDGTSGATGNIVAILNNDPIFPELLLRVPIPQGTFGVGNTITGGSSGATATVVLDNTHRADVIEILHTNTNPASPYYNIPHWYQITPNVNTTLRALHRYAFDQWFDTNLDPSQSLNQTRLIWVNGNPIVYSWLGGVADIVDVTGSHLSISTGLIILSLDVGPWTVGEIITGSLSGATAVVSKATDLNTRLTIVAVAGGPFTLGETITGGTSGSTGLVGSYTPPVGTWAALGFTSLNPKIIVNGVERTTTSGWDSATVSFGATSPTVIAGDVAFSGIDSDPMYQNDGVTPLPLDFCKANKNYMFYGWWKSRRLYQSNAFARDAGRNITFVDSTLDDLTIPVSSVYIGKVNHSYMIRIISTATPNSYIIIRDGITIGGTTITAGTPFALDADYAGLTAEFIASTGHAISDTWTITVTPKITKAWVNFYYSLPTRRPGEGYIFRLPSNFWTMDTQEEKLYANSQYGEWSVVDTELSSDLVNETVILNPLKQSAALKVIDPWIIGHLEDDLVFVSLDKSLMNLGRQIFLQEPQDKYLSDPVKYDFTPCSFTGGNIKYINKTLYISSPEQEVVLRYDVAKRYWQPPTSLPEVGILSIIGNELIAHSNIRNQSFTMYADTSDNGQEYQVVMRTPLNSYFKLVARKRIPARWDSKFASMSFIEGYVTGNPQLFFTAFQGPNDGVGITHLVQPVFSDNTPDRASIGESSLGTHPLGNDLAMQGTYFNEIYRKYRPVMTFYFIALQISCISKNHSYSILSMGVNMAFSPSANNTLIGDRNL